VRDGLPDEEIEHVRKTIQEAMTGSSRSVKKP
jgi:hypothetical protein